MHKIIISLGVFICLASCSSTSNTESALPDASSGSVMNTLSPQREQATDIKLLLEQKSVYILSLLQKSDFSALASQVHPVKGLLLSADMRLDDNSFPRQVLQRKELAGFLINTTPRVWGSNGYTESPLFMTGKAFWETGIYTKILPLNLPRAYDDVLITGTNATDVLEVIQKKFPGSHFVEYQVTSSKRVMEEKDWSLRFIYTEYEGQWYLTGLVRDQFVI